MYSVNDDFRLRLWYENTDVYMVPAELPLPSPTVHDSKCGEFYTDGRAERISKKGARPEDEASPDLEPILMATMTDNDIVWLSWRCVDDLIPI